MEKTNFSAFGPLLHKYGVDLHLCGHAHNYQRLYPSRWLLSFICCTYVCTLNYKYLSGGFFSRSFSLPILILAINQADKASSQTFSY